MNRCSVLFAAPPLCALLGAACGSSLPAAAPAASAIASAVPAPARPQATSSSSSSSSSVAAAAASASAAAGSPEPKQATAPSQHDLAGFPPPAAKPPYARTTKPGDGEWAVLVPGPPNAPALLYATTLHVHPINGWVYVAVVVADLRRVDARFAAGTEEPESSSGPPGRGIVPPEDQPSLLAVHNGGFKTRHGRYGVKIGAETFVPPRDDACTIAFYADPSRPVRIEPWPALREGEPRMTAYRQTPPCLVEGGLEHPGVFSPETSRRWGAAEGGRKDIRRSALGIDATGRFLLYGLGEWVTAAELAAAMKLAGAASAAELDINWSYTHFLLFGPSGPGEPLQVKATLIPKIKHSPTGFVAKRSARDFFYWLRR